MKVFFVSAASVEVTITPDCPLYSVWQSMRREAICDRIIRERERRAAVISRAHWMGRKHYFE